MAAYRDNGRDYRDAWRAASRGDGRRDEWESYGARRARPGGYTGGDRADYRDDQDVYQQEYGLGERSARDASVGRRHRSGGNAYYGDPYGEDDRAGGRRDPGAYVDVRDRRGSGEYGSGYDDRRRRGSGSYDRGYKDDYDDSYARRDGSGYRGGQVPRDERGGYGVPDDRPTRGSRDAREGRSGRAPRDARDGRVRARQDDPGQQGSAGGRGVSGRRDRERSSAPERREAARQTGSVQRSGHPQRTGSSSQPGRQRPSNGYAGRSPSDARGAYAPANARARTGSRGGSTRDALASGASGLRDRFDEISSNLGARAGDAVAGAMEAGLDAQTLVRVALALVTVVLAIAFIRLATCSKPVSDQEYIQVAAGGMPALPPGEVTVVPQVSRVTLSAVGDNLIHSSLANGADRNAGVEGDGLYDFTPMYEHMADILGSHDINFIDMETILGGDELGISGYPEFNTPECMAAQLASCGWNLVTCATNHAWDMGLEGVVNNCEVWAGVEGVTMAGTYSSDADRNRVRTFEQGDITFAFLAYTDVINNTVLPLDPEYAIAVADEKRMAADIEAAKKVADVVIVAMSWGDEDSSNVSAYQEQLAQLLADEGVDLVLGFGPHVIQPVAWVEGKDASGNATGHRTMVVYSLGNFISNQLDFPENVEGCFTCAFELDRTANTIELVDPQWIPLVNHIEGDYHRVYPLADYTAELAAKHDVLGEIDDPIGYVRDRTEMIVGGGDVEIVGLTASE